MGNALGNKEYLLLLFWFGVIAGSFAVINDSVERTTDILKRPNISARPDLAQAKATNRNLAASSEGQALVGLTVWEPSPNLRILIPELQGRAPIEVLSAYLSQVSTDAVYKELFADDPLIDLTQSEVPQNLRPYRSSLGGKPHLAVIANRFGHMKGEDDFLKAELKPFESRGVATFIVPLGLETLLSSKELTKFHNMISTRFEGLMALGGADIDPALYGEEPLTIQKGSQKGESIHFVSQRDRTEFELIKNYIERAHGYFFGICRGHQMAAVVLGFKLAQDLESQLPTKLPHRGVLKKGALTVKDVEAATVWHPIDLVGSDNVLSQVTHKQSFTVNSRHHQAVRPAEGRPAHVIAYEEGKVVEALEFNNQKGLTVQFHPEDMNTYESKVLYDWMAKQLF